MAETTATKSKTRAPKAAKKDTGLFAVIETGGKQYKVKEGDRIKIEKIKGEHKEGDKLTFPNVLLLDDGKGTLFGEPYLSTSKVEAKIRKIAKAPKVTVIKYKAKSRYFKKRGHRQPFFEVEIVSLS